MADESPQPLSVVITHPEKERSLPQASGSNCDKVKFQVLICFSD